MKRLFCKRNTLIAFIILLGCASLSYAQDTQAKQQVSYEKLVDDGVKCLRERKYIEAIGLLREASVQKPQEAIAWFYLGQAYMHSRDYKEAIVAFSHALEIRPKTPDLYFMRAQVYSQTGKFKEALLDLDDEIKANPENADAYLLRSNLLADKGKYDAALSDLEKAKQFGPDSLAQCHFQRAGIFQGMGKKDKASEELKLARQHCKDEQFMDFIKRGEERLEQGVPISVIDPAKLQPLVPEPAKPKRFSAVVDVGGEYSDNMVARSDFSTTPDIVDTIHDIRGILDIYTTFRFVDAASWSVVGNYQYSENWHNQAKEYNLRRHLGRLSLMHRKDQVELGVSAEGCYSSLDRDGYNMYRAFTSWIDILENDWMDTFISYMYINRNYFGDYKGGAYDEFRKNGYGNHVSFTQRFYFDKMDTRYSLGFAVGKERGDGTDNRYMAYKPYMSLDCPLVKPLRSSVYLSWEEDDYTKDALSADFLKKRRNKVFYVDFTLYADIFKNVRIYAGYVHTRFDCNINVYDYTENKGKLGAVFFF